MQEIIKRGLDFIKQNPRIIYSLVLVFIIPVAIYLNTFFTVRNFEENLESIIRSKAVLAEDVVKFVARDNIENPEKLQELILETKKLNSDIGVFEVFVPTEKADGFKVIASSNEADVEKSFVEPKDIFYHQVAWNQPNDNISFVTLDGAGRSWNVVEAIKNTAGEKIGLVSLSFPLIEFDKMNSQAEFRSYVILALTILIVLLLVSNNARLFGYAITLTKLKEIDAMKDTFVSMASHELRTPLTAIKGYAELLNEKIEAKIDDEGKHYFKNIISSVDRLSTLVGDILEVSRLEGNRIPIVITKLDPSPIILQSVEDLRATATQKGLELKYVESALPKIKADGDRLKQIVVNLIGNAIKYTPSGSVEVTAREKDKKFLVTVADTGLGISAEDQKKLFQKFQRIQTDQTREIMGTGLGLWITMELVKKMDGTVTVESIEGVGSHFTVELPLA
jgi:signal transduction histidine kinase